jgi:hypothetical protein
MAFELGTPKDMAEVKRQIARKRNLNSQTVKLYRLLGHKSAEVFPLKEIAKEIPSVLKTIEKIDAEKSSQEKRWPLPDESDSLESVSEDIDPEKVDMMGDHGSPLSGPFYHTQEEWFVWAIRQDPDTLNDADRRRIEEFENSTECEAIFGDESGQRYLDRVKFKRFPAESKPISEGGENERPICQN